jgi:hypothetical protein
MNTKIVLASVFAAVSGLAGVASTAKAGSDIHISLGFGLRPAPVVMVAPNYCAPMAPVIIEHRREEPRGYWREIVVKTWVPARWVVSYVAHGRELRRYEPGYFAYNTDRVWVDLGRDRDFDRDHNRDDYRRG